MPGARLLNERLALPPAPAAVVVRLKPAPSVVVVNPNVPVPPLVTFSITIVPRARLVYVQSRTSVAESMLNVTVAPLIAAGTLVDAEQSMPWRSKPATWPLSVTV